MSKTIIRKGLFKVSLGNEVKKYRAMDEAEAKYKFLTYLGMTGIPYYPTELDVVVIEPTICEAV